MEDCIFCKIVRGELPSHKVYEDDDFLAFLDIHPLTPGHTVVIPKQHFATAWEMTDDYTAKLFPTLKKLAKHLNSELKPQRMGMIIEGFEVNHAHFLLVPLDEFIKDTLNHQTITEPDHTKLAETAHELELKVDN